MKTAMQELMQWMEETEFMVNKGFIDKVHECLEKEKKQIIDAYDTAIERPIENYAEKYYNQTYNK
jgi:hypothetical protein